MVQQARTNWSDRGRETTRLRILDAARELFARDGVEATSVRSIAERCGLSDAAIYYYYPTKADILDALLAMPGIGPLQAAADGATSRVALQNLLADFICSWAGQADLLRVLLREGLEGNSATMTFSSNIRASVETGLLPALRELYGPAPSELPHALCMLLCGLMYDTLLTHGAGFEAIASEPAFRERVLGLLDFALPMVAC